MQNENHMVYFHIPFCKQKCNYCSFVSYPCATEGYIEALLEEIACFYKGETISTLYFGGGTPSLLAVEDFKRLIEPFKLTSDAEITVELNPESTDKKLLEGLYKLGVNRLSIGVQSFDNDTLRVIGRLHNSKKAKETVKAARKTGFENISIDLIYGLPGQSLNDWGKTLEEALTRDIDHISLYGLKIEQGSYFFNNPPKNLPDGDLQADMYLSAIDKLKDFEHYEISNFARKYDKGNKKSIHNMGYWSLVPYYGFGVSASGYLGSKRYVNTKDLRKYLENPVADKGLEDTNALEEEIFLGFRKIEGINTLYISEKYGIDFDKKYKNVLGKYREHILKTQNGYKLSTEGVLLSNVVLSDFL